MTLTDEQVARLAELSVGVPATCGAHELGSAYCDDLEGSVPELLTEDFASVADVDGIDYATADRICACLYAAYDTLRAVVAAFDRSEPNADEHIEAALYAAAVEVLDSSQDIA
jgi:hypothetical protein